MMTLEDVPEETSDVGCVVVARCNPVCVAVDLRLLEFATVVYLTFTILLNIFLEPVKHF